MSSRQRPARGVALTALFALLCAAAVMCSNPTDDSVNKLPEPVITGDGGGGGGDCGACDCIKVGDWYRFTELQLVTIDNMEGHAITQVLNPIWQADIDKDQLNFYMEVKAVSATEAVMRVVNGARVANATEVCLLEYTSVEVIHPRKGCCLNASKPTSMNVYAGTNLNPKNCAPSLPVPHAIPVRKAVLETRLMPDAVDGCSEVSGTVLAGSLARSALAKICTCLGVGQDAEKCGLPDPAYDDGKELGCNGCSKNYLNLLSLMVPFKPTLPFGCTAEDDSPAACLTARFAGARIDAPPKACP